MSFWAFILKKNLRGFCRSIFPIVLWLALDQTFLQSFPFTISKCLDGCQFVGYWTVDPRMGHPAICFFLLTKKNKEDEDEGDDDDDER